MTDEQNTEETESEEPSEGYKDESPAEPVEAGADIPEEDPSTPAHEVVEEVHEEQAENTEQVESD